MASEPVVESNLELYQTEKEALDESENLSEEQKIRLSQLLEKSKVQTQLLDDDIMKTKSVLFKSLLDEKSPRAKINLLENQLLKLNRQKIRQTLNSYREARAIVGKSERSLDRTLNMIDNKTIIDF